ncbi:MAG TPA: hypothetical protein VGS19_29290 [Streptosporangiaceae bacterium]|nr:hypothetical protein [Streptosporangiaceae bacterium]
MSSDRGTLTRGAYPPQDQDGRIMPTPPSARKPPSVPRERKPALAALALLLIVGGALGAAYLVTQNGHRVAAIEVTQPVGVGQQIPVGAMAEVQVVPSSGLPYIPWDEAGQVTRYYAATSIPAGTLLTNAMVAPATSLAAGRDVVGLALKEGQFPLSLQIGDHVTIYQVANSPGSCPGTAGSVLSTNAVVLGVGFASSSSNSGTSDVRVAVNPADAGAVTCNAANGNVGVAVLPAHGGSAVSGPAPASSTVPSQQATHRHLTRRGRHGTAPSSGTTPSTGATPSSSATPSSGVTG